MKLTPSYIDPRAATADLPYPAGEPAHLKLDVPFGKIVLEAGAGDSLVSGKVTYNVEELKPRYSVQGRTVRIRQDYRVLIPTGRITNNWEFLLGTAKPYSLEVNAGASATEMELGGLPLLGLDISSGAGDVVLNFATPNPETLIEGHIQAGAGRTTVRGLLNANFERFRINGGVGQMVLHFTGDGLIAGRARVEGGVGEIIIVVDSELPIRVRTSTGLGGVSADEGLIRSDKGYQTTSYAGSDVRLDIDVRSGVGSIRVEMA